MNMTEMLKKLGEKTAVSSIDPFCWPKLMHQPKPPAKILEKMQEKK